MSNVNKNPLVKGASGNFGKDFVYRTRGRKTIIAKMPTRKKDAPVTEQQTKVRDLFSSAAMYAQGVISSPELKKEYQKKVSGENTAYNIAFRDFLKPPKVRDIDTSNYTGAIGSKITVVAKDDFRVRSVKVAIRTPAGSLIEEGEANLDPIHRERWNYIATQNNASLAGTIINATAFDIPENKGTLEVTV